MTRTASPSMPKSLERIGPTYTIAKRYRLRVFPRSGSGGERLAFLRALGRFVWNVASAERKTILERRKRAVIKQGVALPRSGRLMLFVWSLRKTRSSSLERPCTKCGGGSLPEYRQRLMRDGTFAYH